MHAGERRTRIDHAENAVHEGEVESGAVDRVGQCLEVALHGMYAITDTDLGRAAREGRERIDADIDHGYLRPELRERDGNTARTATTVEHLDQAQVGRADPSTGRSSWDDRGTQ
jgi:hypothetical protein